MLAFQLDHAHARDAVYSDLAIDQLQEKLNILNIESITVRSTADTREEYLQRPDNGKRLNDASKKTLNDSRDHADVVFILADGLSAEAINKHAIPVLTLLLAAIKSLEISLATVVIAEQSRVALGDEIGSLLNAKLSLIFIGERPGLSSPDSMGVYITYDPKPGKTDESRNCISNIRPEGLGYEKAAEKILYFIHECLRQKLSGVSVKDLSGLIH